MAMQQSQQEWSCPQCRIEFNSAAVLLQHYAMHASQNLLFLPKSTGKKSKIPDLYPINFRRKGRSETDVESDSGIEDVVNPMKFCLVTMSDDGKNGKKSPNNKRYQCKYCSKRFGWSTDLKRHILTHTGEKPFACKLCDCAFTRNFLLLKHQKRCHSAAEKAPLPDLKPLGVVVKSRKQNKDKIVRISATKKS